MLGFLMGGQGPMMAAQQAPAGLDELLGAAPQPPPSPYQTGAAAGSPILENYLPQLAGQFGQAMGDYQNARNDANHERMRSNRRDGIDEFVGNVLMPATAIGLPGAVNLAMGESKRILEDLGSRRKDKLNAAETHANLVNNLAKIIKQVDPADLDNQLKQREQMIREQQMKLNEDNSLADNTRADADLREKIRMNGVNTANDDRSFAQHQLEHADAMALAKQSHEDSAARLAQDAAQARATGDNARANRLMEMAKLAHGESVKAAEAERTARVKAIELSRQDAATASEQVMNAKTGKAQPKHPGYKPKTAEEYMGTIAPTNSAPAFDWGALMQQVAGVAQSDIEAEMKRRGLVGKKKK